MDEITKEFLLESYEGLDKFERDLMSYEKNPSDKEKLAQIYRTLHTLKGTSGFLGYARLAKLAHSGENILSLLRADKLKITRVMTGGLLALVDSIRRILSHVETDQTEGKADDSSILSRMEALAQLSPTLPSDSSQVSASVSPKTPEGSSSTPSVIEDTALRIDVAQLDHLMNLSGELVLARNQALQWALSEKNPQWISRLQPLSDLSMRLQEKVMKARLQPISVLWNRFPRLVRDIGDACGKKVVLEMIGGETEVDKGLLELIRDPLTHLVRNAVDHGLESPENRQKAGKSPDGKLRLKASHESGQVLVEVSDDGAGLSLEKIRAKAVQEKLITAEEAAHLDMEKASQLIFQAGFSTAKEVTQFSGRGVGMDVVKANLDRMGGKVEVESKKGQGTLFRLRIPLTLAVLPALLVETGGQTFVLPRAALKELIRLDPEKASKELNKIHQAPVYRLRGKLLPLVILREVLAFPPDTNQAQRTRYIAVLNYDRGDFGLLLEGVGDFQEVVVKPLGHHLKTIPVWSGSTILGDGRVTLILDVRGLAQKAGIEFLKTLSESESVPQARTDPTSQEGVSRKFLVFKTASMDRLALDLESVLRLASFLPEEVQSTGAVETVPHEGKLLLLLRSARLLSRDDSFVGPSKKPDEKTQAVVCSHKGKTFALEVEEALDILESPSAEISDCLGRPGIRGTLPIGGQSTDLVDLEGLLRLESLRAGGEKGWNQPEFFEGLGIA